VPSRERGGTGPTSDVFLYGDVGANFTALSEPFVRACGGKHSKISLLMLPRSQRYAATYRDAWRKAGAGEVTAICPPRSMVLTTEQLRTLRESTGIFMAGGPTSLYQRAYGTKIVSRVIRKLYDSGVPYGGVSAGAKMACDYCSVGGSLVRTRTNEFQLGSNEYVESYRKQRPGERAGLVIRRGLGLVEDCVLQPHFAEWGLFPGLMEAMNLTGSRFGVGLDSSICLEIRDGRRAIVHGRGRLYFFRSETDGRGGPRFQVQLYEPGARFEFPSA